MLEYFAYRTVKVVLLQTRTESLKQCIVSCIRSVIVCKMVLETETLKSCLFCVRPWPLLTILSFSEGKLTAQQYFNVSTPSSRRGTNKSKCEKGVLRNFTKFTEKHLCQSLFFNKVAALRPATLLKKRLWHSCFPVNFVKFLRTPFLHRIPLDDCF